MASSSKLADAPAAAKPKPKPKPKGKPKPPPKPASAPAAPECPGSPEVIDVDEEDVEVQEVQAEADSSDEEIETSGVAVPFGDYLQVRIRAVDGGMPERFYRLKGRTAELLEAQLPPSAANYEDGELDSVWASLPELRQLWAPPKVESLLAVSSQSECRQ